MSVEDLSAPGMGSEMTRLHETGTLDDYMSCPYNPHHVMKASRFMIHLVKCRKQHPEKAAEISICLYNHSHHVYTVDMPKHLALCPQYHHFLRTVLPSLKARAEREANGIKDPPPAKAEELPPPTEEEIAEMEEWL